MAGDADLGSGWRTREDDRKAKTECKSSIFEGILADLVNRIGRERCGPGYRDRREKRLHSSQRARYLLVIAGVFMMCIN